MPATFRALLWSSFYTLGIASGAKPVVSSTVGGVREPPHCSLLPTTGAAILFYF